MRSAVLVFWALIVSSAIAFGALSYLVPLLVIAVCCDVMAFGEVRRYGNATDPALLTMASLSSIIAATLFVAPTLIEQALGDGVHICFGECGEQSGTNIVGAVVWGYLFGVISATLALVSWIGYLVRAFRHRRSGVTPANPPA